MNAVVAGAAAHIHAVKARQSLGHGACPGLGSAAPETTLECRSGSVIHGTRTMAL